MSNEKELDNMLNGAMNDAYSEYQKHLTKARVRNQILESELHDLLKEALEIARLIDDEQDHFMAFETVQMELADIKRAMFPPLPPENDRHKLTARLHRSVMERDKYRCKHCGTHLELQIDHVIPVCKGGKTVFENLQVLCKGCNTTKGRD